MGRLREELCEKKMRVQLVYERCCFVDDLTCGIELMLLRKQKFPFFFSFTVTFCSWNYLICLNKICLNKICILALNSAFNCINKERHARLISFTSSSHRGEMHVGRRYFRGLDSCVVHEKM